MSFRFLLILTFFLIFSCKNNDYENDLYLPKDKMINILIEIHLLEEKVNQLNYSEDSLKTIYELFEKEIFKNHDVSDEEYRKSYSYYFFDPKQLDEIYQSVIDSLNIYNQSINGMKY